MLNNMRYILFAALIIGSSTAIAQADANYTIEKKAAATPIKNQGLTGTCWNFSTTSLIESQCLKNNLGEQNISEMFSVRNIYLEKAHNYILRQGHAQFSEGGLGHDLIRAIGTWGAMPESVYTGLVAGQKQYDHQKLFPKLQSYLDSVLKKQPVAANWITGYTDILNQYLPEPPATFDYNGKQYTPLTFAKDVLKFNADDYVNITSFTHHSYYKPFILEVPDNFSNGAYYNLPLDEMISTVKTALQSGYSVLWDADVSNNGFRQQSGTALSPSNISGKEDVNWSAEARQVLFENLTTQDDHLMHIVGIEKNKAGETFFLVKNSWGDIGPDHGYINVSVPYFAINTISLVIPKAALSKELLGKLSIK